MTTLRDIATQLDLSVGLVSRVLNDKADVRTSNATRERIVNTARALDYRPSATARALVTGRTMQIAAIYDGGDTGRHASDGHPDLRGLVEAAARYDYRVVVVPLRDGDEGEANLDRLLRDRTVDGVCLFSHQVGAPHLRALEAHPLPCVVIGDPSELDWGHNHLRAARVDFDNYRYAFDSTLWLAAQGHRRIAYARGVGEIEHSEGHPARVRHQQHTWALQRGYRDAMKHIGELPQLLAPHQSHDEIVAFARSGRASAVVVRYLHGALAWTMALRVAGFDLPREFAVLAQLECADLASLHLAGCGKFIAVHVRDQRALGAIAGEKLVNWVRGEKPVSAETLVAPPAPCRGDSKSAAEEVREGENSV